MEEMRKETVDIIEDILYEMNRTFVVDGVIQEGGDVYTLLTCDTLYLHELKDITIDGNEYRITSVLHNTSITITGDVLPNVDSFEIPLPTYFHGKAIDTNAELDMVDDKETITPLVYLTETYTDRMYPNDQLKERDVDLRIFFLTTANYDDWLTNEHYDKVIRPMRNLVYNFIETLDKSKIIGKFASYYDLTNHAKFGIFILRKGATQRIFDDNFSGVELNIRLPILKDMTTDGCC